MKQFRKKQRLKIGCKWVGLFLLLMTAFFTYQKFLGDAYETQVISWIGNLREMGMEQAVFLTPDEKSYQTGSEILKDAGYEDTGKNYLQNHIKTYGRTFFCLSLLTLCAAGAVWDIHQSKKEEQAVRLFVEEETTSASEKIQKEKEYIKQEREKMGTYMENISHQLKTPMTGTILCLDNLLDMEDDSYKKEKLQNCIRQLEWMNDMTMVLLRLAQIDSGKIWMNRKRENLTRLIENCVKRMTLFANEKDIQMQTELQDGCILSCDAFWIKEAVENVLKNAIDFTPPKGIVRISLQESEDTYEIRTFNSGEKLKDEYREVIFERFYQLDSKRNNGFGIGLNLARGIIKLHQGTLEVLDTAEEGTTFQFLIPKMIAKDNSKQNLTEL